MSADPRHQRSDDELRRALADAPAPGTLDAGDVIRRARHRRRLSTVATTGVAALAVVAIVGIGATALDWMPRPSSDSTVAADSARDGAEAGSMEEQSSAEAEGSTLTAPASPHSCGLPPSDSGPGDSDLALTTSFKLRVVDGTETLEGAVTLANTGDTDIRAEVLGQPIVALARDGVTVSRSDGEPGSGTIAVTLAPGESVDIDATLAAVSCATGVTTGSPADSPLAAGDYDVAAALMVSQDGAEAIEIVGSGEQSITLE